LISFDAGRAVAACRQDGCVRARILNRFCYGQCNSFYIPRSHAESYAELVGDADAGAAGAAAGERRRDSSFRSCAVCAPTRTDWTTVTLRCPRLLPPFRRRRVRVVRRCSCLAVRVRHR